MPHKRDGIVVNGLKIPINVVYDSFKCNTYKKPMLAQDRSEIIIKYLFFIT